MSSQNSFKIPVGSGQHYTDAALYEHEYKRRRDDVNFYAACARGELSPGADVLEICCGSGRVTRKLLRSGFHVTGLDISAPMLKRAEESVRNLPLRFRNNAEFIRCNMIDFNLDRSFPLIIMAFNSFEHLYTHKEISTFLGNVRNHMDKDSLFTFDVQLPHLPWLVKSADKRWARTKFKHPKTGQQLAYSTNHIYNHVTQIVHIRLYYEPLSDGPVQETQIVELSQRKFFPQELKALLENAGFEVLMHKGDFHGHELDEFAESQVLQCRLQ